MDVSFFIKWIFLQLYCTPCLEGSVFEFGHDYGGAAITHLMPRPLELDILSSGYYDDPFSIPSIDDMEVALPNPLGSDDDRRLLSFFDDTGNRNHQTQQRRKRNFFDMLPTEVLFEIFSFISFDELLNLRLVCRTLALSATVNTLPQSYWRSRFLLGQEADYLVSMNLHDKQDWSRPFFWTRSSLRKDYSPLANLKRIWNLVAPIADLVEQRLAIRKHPDGYEFHWANSQGKSAELIRDKSIGKPPEPMEVSSSFSGQLTSVHARAPLNLGCRVFQHKAQQFMPPGQYDCREIGIFTVQIGARIFISGITSYLSKECHTVNHSIGYCYPSSETWIEIPSSSHVEALCVAFCPEGLRGINVVFANSESSDWIGDSSGMEIAYGTLSTPEKNLDSYFLLADLDYYKIVSLGLGKLTGDASASAKSSSQGATDSSCVQSQTWESYPPNHENLAISVLLVLLPDIPSPAFAPRISIDFGGLGGLHLRSLTILIFHMSEGPCPINGVEMFYSDGSSVLSGSTGSCEMSFFINGPGGERINEVAVVGNEEDHHTHICLGGLRVFFPLYIFPIDSCSNVDFNTDLDKLWTSCCFHSSSHSYSWCKTLRFRTDTNCAW